MQSIDNFNLTYSAHGHGKHVYFQLLTKTGKKTIIRCNPDTMVAKVVDILPDDVPEVGFKKLDESPVRSNSPETKKDCGCSKKKKQKKVEKAQEKPEEGNQEEPVFVEDKQAIGFKKTILGVNSVGFGDTVKLWIETVSFGLIKQKPGCGCQRRQHLLNKWFPYKSNA